MSELHNLDDLFVHTLRHVYDAEQRLTKALPKMAKNAEAPQLREALTSHLQETRIHVQRIERVFGLFNQKPNADTDDALKGIVKASDDTIKLDAGDAVKDAAIVAAAQEAEHYEIAAYGTLRTWAQMLEKPQAVQLFERTLEEEKQADQRLTAIASSLNFQAAAAAAR